MVISLELKVIDSPNLHHAKSLDEPHLYGN